MRSRLMIVAAVTAALGACESIERPLSALTGTATPSPASTTSSSLAETLYVGKEDLAVRDAPAASSRIIGHLELHESVSRSRIEHGYAYITAIPRELQGWVDNTQLSGRQPQSPPAIAGHGARPIAPESASAPLTQDVATATGADGTASAAAAPPPAQPTPAAAGVHSQEKPVVAAEAEAEMVDPF